MSPARTAPSTAAARVIDTRAVRPLLLVSVVTIAACGGTPVTAPTIATPAPVTNPAPAPPVTPAAPPCTIGATTNTSIGEITTKKGGQYFVLGPGARAGTWTATVSYPPNTLTHVQMGLEAGLGGTTLLPMTETTAICWTGAIGDSFTVNVQGTLLAPFTGTEVTLGFAQPPR